MEGLHIAKYEETMEVSLQNLRRKVHNFLNRQKRVYHDYRAKLEFKECEQRILESRLNQAIIKLESLKQKILQQTKTKSLYYETKKQCDKLQKDLTDCMKVRYLYEDHADLIKREMNTKLNEKDSEIDKYKKETEKLTKICLQNEATLISFKTKLKSKSQLLESKLNETGKFYLQEKQKSASLQEKLLEKHNKMIAKKKEMETMKTELEKYRSAKYEQKIAEKQRENVMLREEVAILKVELEKARVKGLL